MRLTEVSGTMGECQFSQIGASLDRAQGGLGIGLSLVRRLVEMHGGSVTAESTGAGEGSTFIVRLPLELAACESASLLAKHDSLHAKLPAAGTRVLVVDDNVDSALTLSMILKLKGYTTRVAHDGIEAIEVYREFMPRLAFVDIGMPRMNGYETATALRAIPKTTQLELVAVTGWGTDSDRERSEQSGFDHHLTKPVQFSDIEHILVNLDQGT